MSRFPLTAQSIYADLLRRLQDDEVLDLGGTPVVHTVEGKRYWYTRRYANRKSVRTYLGPETPELLARIEQMKEQVEARKVRQARRRQMVKALVGAGYFRPETRSGKVLSAIASAGAFRLRAVLIGTHAYQCYSALLGVEIDQQFAVTEDIDFAQFKTVALAVDDKIDPAFADVLRTVDQFSPRPTLADRTNSASWTTPEGDAVVDLLAPTVGPDIDGLVELPALQAYAQPVRFLDYLIHETESAAVLYRDGVLVRVPRPARYAIHKLIVATQRGNHQSVKASKDINQAAALIDVLAEDRPDELEDAYKEAFSRGPKWRNAIEKGLRRLNKETQAKLHETV